MDIIKDIVNTIVNNFDFTYIIVINILTYIIIKCIDIINKDRNVKSSQKRLVLSICIFIVYSLYYINGYDDTIKLLNSSILAPVAWSWILKPICKKFNIDYKDIGKYLD